MRLAYPIAALASRHHLNVHTGQRHGSFPGWEENCPGGDSATDPICTAVSGELVKRATAKENVKTPQGLERT